MPEDLEKQLPFFEELIPLFGIPQISDPKEEADDLIAGLVKQAKGWGQEVIIASNDKDFFQLLEPGVRVLRQAAGQTSVLVDEPWLEKEWGLKPAQIVDYLSLIGDSVDEIKGIDGVGDKTARKWLSEFGSLEGIFKNLDRLPPRFQEKMRGELQRLEINRKVITLRTDLTPHIEMEHLRLKTPEYSRLCKRLRDLEFKTLPAELEAEAKAAQPESQKPKPGPKKTEAKSPKQGELF
jgi:DNA polymerase-1